MLQTINAYITKYSYCTEKKISIIKLCTYLNVNSSFLASGGGATRPLPRNGGVQELHGDPTAGPRTKSRTWCQKWKKQCQRRHAGEAETQDNPGGEPGSAEGVEQVALANFKIVSYFKQEKDDHLFVSSAFWARIRPEPGPTYNSARQACECITS